MVTAHIQVELVVAPFTTHQLQRCKTQVGFGFESSHEHTHEADCREILNITHFFIIIGKRYGELIPSSFLSLAIACMNISHLFVGDVVLAHFHCFGFNIHFILEVAFVLVQRIILIDVLDIGRGTGSLVLAITDIGLRQGVTIGAVIMLVAVVDGVLMLVIVTTTIECIVVACGVIQR